MEETYNTLDVEIDFSKKAMTTYFGYPAKKQIKSALNKNNYTKLCLYLKKENETTIHYCLIYAIHFKLDKISKKILQNFYITGIKLNANKNHSELFKYAIYYNKIFLVTKLLDLGVDIHIDNDYALIQYCLLENQNMVTLLINHGADIHARNSLALIQASGNGSLPIVKILLEKMEKQIVNDINLGNHKVYQQPTNFDIAMIGATLNNHYEIVHALLLKGANPSINNSEVLINSVEKGNAEMVKLFLEFGVDPNILDGTVIKKAVKEKYLDVVDVLVNFERDGEYVCDLSIDDSAALRWAAYKGHYDILKILLESKTKFGNPRCNVNAENNDAYRLAVKYDHKNVIKLLEKYGGNDE
jgi:ankyrin repeat protein